MPNFFIDKFRIPPFLLPIYQAAGMQYGVRWEILAAINEIETDYGRNLNISSAGAVGWMQFMPPTWDAYGVDANRDGVKDPFNPVDAIFAAARYLNAAGAETDIRRAVFAYNHADWYVDSVLMRAQVIGGLPGDLVGSLTGLTQGRFPVYAKSTYAGQLTKKGNKVKQGNAAMVVESDAARRGIKVFSRERAPVIAVNDGRVVKMGKTKRLGRFVMLQDVYGNTYTYAHLGEVSRTYPAPKPRSARRNKKERPPTRDAKRVEAEAETETDWPPSRPSRSSRSSRPSRPLRCRSRSACSPTRRAPRPAPPAATSSSPRPARRRPRARRSASTPATSARRRSRRAHACSAAPSSAASAPRPPSRRRTSSSRSARPAAAPRGSTRSRSSTAGSCSSRPPSTAPRARTRSSAPMPRRRRSASCCC